MISSLYLNQHNACQRSEGLKAMTKVNLRHIKSLTGAKSAISVNNVPPPEASLQKQNSLLNSASMPSTAVSAGNSQRDKELHAADDINEEHLQLQSDNSVESSTEQDGSHLEASIQENTAENGKVDKIKTDNSRTGENLSMLTLSSKKRVVLELKSSTNVRSRRRRRKEVPQPIDLTKLREAKTTKKYVENKSAIFAVSNNLPTKGAGEEVTAGLSTTTVSKKSARPISSVERDHSSKKIFIQKQSENLPKLGLNMKKTTATVKLKSSNSRIRSSGVGRAKKIRRKNEGITLEPQNYRLNIIPIKQRHSPILHDWSKPSSIRSLLH